MSGDVRLFNRQRRKPIDRPEWRQLVLTLLVDFWKIEEFDIAIHFVAAAEMARLNKKHLDHAGSTDVITLDYGNGRGNVSLCGEIFICLDDTEAQARQFSVHWRHELARYIIHGLLHLRGYDDLSPGPRREMKRQENRRLRQLSGRFSLSKGHPKSTLPP